MSKQQTLTLVVPDELADPAVLVEKAIDRYLDGCYVIVPPDLLFDPADVEVDSIVLIEED